MTKRLLVLVVLAGLGFAFAFSRLAISFDLAFFVPAPANFAEEVLTDRVGAGPGVKLILIDVEGVDASTIDDLRNRLADDNRFEILDTADAPGIGAIPAPLWQHRFVLADMPQDQSGWEDAFNERLADISFLSDADSLELIAADPALTALAALGSLAAGEPPEHLLVLNSRAPVFDLDAQAAAVAGLRNLLDQAGVSPDRAFGSPIYAVDVQTTIQAESLQLTVLASIALLTLLFWRLRRPSAVAASAVPLLAGAAAAVVGLALVYDTVHGITLAFGFTLLGVAIDFPLHLLSVARDRGLGGRALAADIWPTLSIGIASTLVGYLAFVLSGSPGIVQLGVMALAGIAGAAAASAWMGLSIDPTPDHATQPSDAAAPPRLRHIGWAGVLLVAGAGLYFSASFDDDLADLTPIPKPVIERDAAARAELGGDDLSRFIALKDASLPALLERTEALREPLVDAIAAGQIEGFRLITDLLPDADTQNRRLERVRTLANDPAPIQAALAATALEPEAFEPFLTALQQAALPGEQLELSELTEHPGLSSAVDALLYQRQDGWVSLIPLSGVSATPELPEGATWVDLRAASSGLIERFRVRLGEVLGLALLAIAAVLALATRSLNRTVWVLGCTFAALAVSAWVTSAVFGGLTLFALVSLALVAGLSLDYGLFHSKPDAGPASQRAVALCAASSLIVFGLLATADVPILGAIGLTVAVGVGAAWLISRASARPAVD